MEESRFFDESKKKKKRSSIDWILNNGSEKSDEISTQFPPFCLSEVNMREQNVPEKWK